MKPEYDYETLISFASQLLGLRDFTGAKEYALSAKKSDPNRPDPAQIIAIADVLIAADDDWAAVLQLETLTADRACIRSQFTKLTALLHPSKNRFPFSQEAFDHVCKAWSAMNKLKEEENNSCSNLGTFWTVCPYCYCAHEYGKEYEDFCLRCQNCRLGFHGVAAAMPPPTAAEGSSAEYYCGYGCFPLKYEKKGVPDVMEISDDSEEEKKEVKKKKKYMKAIPKYSRRMTGTGMRKKKTTEEAKTGNAATDGGIVAEETKSGGSGSDCELEFLLKDDGVYVGLKDVDALLKKTFKISREYIQMIKVSSMAVLFKLTIYCNLALPLKVRGISSFYKSRAHPNSIDYRQVASSLDAYRHSLQRRRRTKAASCREEAKEMSKEKHKYSERDRRNRVSRLYSDLRMILPNLVKKNKASVLHETIRQVRQMNSTALALNAVCGGGLDCVYPGGDDCVTVENDKGKGGGGGGIIMDRLLKVTVSCDDRSKLMADIGNAVRYAKAKVVRAEMVTVGGRTKCVFWVKGVDGFEGKRMLSMAINACCRRP
ncbi:Transcription factor bHLH131 [Linum perenne]